jgi:hypothetical protein
MFNGFEVSIVISLKPSLTLINEFEGKIVTVYVNGSQ